MFHSLSLIFQFYRETKRNYSEINQEEAIKEFVTNEKIRDFLIFSLPKDNITEAKIFLPNKTQNLIFKN